jgi:hypothetical protein
VRWIRTTAAAIDDPSVYLEPDGGIVPATTREAWCSLIEKAMRTDPGARWANAGELAAALRAVSAGPELSGWVRVSYPWGDRPNLVREEGGDLQTAWIIAER